eukprot:UN11268
MNEQRKCSVYKYFGSSLYSLQKTYKGKNYSVRKSKDLLSIVDKCLLSYDINDFENGKNNNNNQNECKDNECKNNEYFKIPLRLRLQNRGYLRIINESFYEHIAIKMYTIITGTVQQVFTCYDPKQIKQIEHTIMNDKSIFAAFDKHVGLMIDNGIEEQNNKKKVLKDLAHSVTSRVVLSLVKRNKTNTGHVGQFRTGIKALHGKKTQK